MTIFRGMATTEELKAASDRVLRAKKVVERDHNVVAEEELERCGTVAPSRGYGRRVSPRDVAKERDQGCTRIAFAMRT
jgi:hypothetical protein